MPELRQILDRHTLPLIERFPLKADIRTIAARWNDFFKNKQDIYSYGLQYGWLEEFFDLKNYRLYNYVPYQFIIGLVVHKGHCNIEEDNLLKDSFNILLKSEHYYRVLQSYGEKLYQHAENHGLLELDRPTYSKVTYVKYEVSTFSRLTIVSFYAFVESFVNSVGYSYLKRNQRLLSAWEWEILTGKKKDRYLQLKSKIEQYQKIIRIDKKAVMITSDERQMTAALKNFFAYEELRNSAMHYSLVKVSLSKKPEDWVRQAKDFAGHAMEVAKQFWTACYPDIDAPEYLGRLDFQYHHDLAESRLKSVIDIEHIVSSKSVIL